MTLLIRITAPNFVAGFEVNDKGHVKLAAPILHWTIGKEYRELHFRNDWKIECILGEESDGTDRKTPKDC